MNVNDPLKLMEYEQYRETLNKCGYMTYGQLQDLLEVKENDYTLGNLLSMVIRTKPSDLIKLYNKHFKGDTK